MGDDREYVIRRQNGGSLAVGGQTRSNGSCALCVVATVVNREVLRSATQHSKGLDFSLPDSSRLGESNYQVWLLKMIRILEKHRIWIYCFNPISCDAITETEIKGRKLALDAILELVRDSLIQSSGTTLILTTAGNTSKEGMSQSGS